MSFETPRPLPEALVAIAERSPQRAAAHMRFLEALTHRTYVNELRGARASDNQRLELLGDAVLELLVTEQLYAALPDADEGLLSRARAAVVNEAALAEGARAIALGPSLRLGRGERARGGDERVSTLADALEAVIAAAYLIAGLEAARTLVDQSMGPRIAEVVRASIHDSEAPRMAIDVRAKDPKSVLQELTQQDRGALPVYAVELEGATGFVATVSVDGVVVGRGEGRSKREAEVRAAEAAIASPTIAARLHQRPTSTP